MRQGVDRAAVLGAGVMGSAIAAHLVGAGIRTYLFDVASPAPARNRLALDGIEAALRAKPALFYDPEAARLITTGNFDDDLDRLKDCDLVIEAVIEKLDVKQSLLARVAKVIGPEALLASNTSGLSMAALGSELPEDVQRHLLVMHFFNPVRYMRLLEIVPGPKTDPQAVARAASIGEMLGKGIVYGKDTPNFVANRIGVYGMLAAIQSMTELGLTIEEVDKIAGPPMGRPASAVFRTGDLVGIDTLVHVADNCHESLGADEERDTFKTPDWIRKLVAGGRRGQKSGAGFYKKEGSDILVLDLKTLEYRPQAKVRYDSLGAIKNIESPGERIKALVAADDKAARFAWNTLARTLCYSARRVGEIADDIVNIDRALRWGFNWDLGPFETWDAIGVESSVERMTREGLDVPRWVKGMLGQGRASFYDGSASERRYYDLATERPGPVPYDRRHVRLAALHDDSKRVIRESLGAALVDLGDGALCFEVHTKMNTIDPDVIATLGHAIEEAERNYEALVIANDGEHFGAGANLMLIYVAAQQKQSQTIDTIVRSFQSAMQRLRYAKVPVVAAPFGYTLAGAAEMAMAADACQAHAETYLGLVEVGVGLLPAGGGCLRMVERWTEDFADVPGADVLPHLGQALLNIATARASTGAEEARRLRYLRRTDGISLNRDHLLHQAKERALGMARAGYRPARPRVFKAAGLDAAKTMALQIWSTVEAGRASAHDALIANKVAHVLCGGRAAAGTERSEQDYLDLEREAFLSLCGEEKTQARIQAMLTTGKPLRN